MRVLADVKRGIERAGTSGPCKQDDHANGGARFSHKKFVKMNEYRSISGLLYRYTSGD
jgi:hypothetical protein